MAEESYLDKIGAAINKYTGGDYMERTRERARKKLEQAAPGSTEAIDKASWALEQTPMIGMARARALKDVKKAADTAKKMRGTKGGSKVIETAKDASGVYVPKSGPKARGRASGSQGSPGTSYSKKSLESTRTRQRTEKEANKFGPLVKRDEKMPAVQKKNVPAVVREENRGIVPYKRPGAVARYDAGNRQVRTFGDKGAADKARIVGLSRMGKAAVAGGAMGLGALGYALSPSAKKSQAAGEGSSGAPKPAAGARPGESTKGYGKAKGSNKPATGGKGESAKPKAAGDKSRLSGKKMTNFERMKARQYEKEGYGGRAMTGERARAQVVKERGYKVSDLFKRKSSGSKPSGKSFDGRFKSDAAKRFAKLRQGRSK
jgi:hypothetical protein